MNTMTRVSILAVFGTLATAAFADAPSDAPPTPPPPPHHMMHKGMMHDHRMMHDGPFMMAVHQLNLTAEQKKQVHDIVQKSREQARANMAAHKNQFMGLMNPGDPNYANAVQAAKDAAVARIEQMSKDNTDIYNLLTDKQKADLPKVLEKMKAREMERMNHWKDQRDRGPGPGPGTGPARTPAQ